ncbi:MAG: DUF819 family protein [Bacteroidota bacterium]
MDAYMWVALALAILFPIPAIWAYKRKLLPSWLSPIIACYGIGIIIANSGFWPSYEDLKVFTERIAGFSMLLGLPLLLFAVRLDRRTLRLAGPMLIAFGFCAIAGIISTSAVSIWLADSVPDTPVLGGMLAGMYTGGTPNVQAIGTALRADSNYLVLIQAADILLGGAYLIGLITFLPGVYARIFPAFQELSQQSEQEKSLTKVFPQLQNPILRGLVQFLLGLLVTGLSLGLTRLLSGSIENFTLLILLLTSLGLAVTFIPKLDRLGDPYPLGEYFILVFCVAIGLLANFSQLASEGMQLLLFCTLSIIPTIIILILLCRWWGIDRDTFILSSVAGLYGPVFVAQISAVLGNRSLLAPGLAVSLLGFGIGNYLGIGLAYLLSWITGVSLPSPAG